MIFLDTEFTGLDQDKPDLISIGSVDGAGRELYAELPLVHYAVQCNGWVHFNVVPHLWGEDHVHSVAATCDRLTAWLAGIQDCAVIVRDYPDPDFRLLCRLLAEWPNNLAPAPMLFTAWSMGDDEQPELHARMASYHTPERPAHYALHDAHSLRIGALYTLGSGWQLP